MADYDALLKRLDELHRTEWLNHEAAAAIRDLQRQVAEAKAEARDEERAHKITFTQLEEARNQRDALAAAIEKVRAAIKEYESPDSWNVPCVYTSFIYPILDAAPAAILNDRLAQAFDAGVDATNEAWENVVRAPRVKEAGDAD